MEPVCPNSLQLFIPLRPTHSATDQHLGGPDKWPAQMFPWCNTNVHSINQNPFLIQLLLYCNYCCTRFVFLAILLVDFSNILLLSRLSMKIFSAKEFCINHTLWYSASQGVAHYGNHVLWLQFHKAVCCIAAIQTYRQPPIAIYKISNEDSLVSVGSGYE